MMASDEITEKASLTSEDLSPQDTAIAILSADYAVLSCNRGFENLTGHTLQVLDHVKLADLFEPAEPLNEILHRVYAGGSPASVRIRLRMADSTPLPVEVYCEPLQTRDHSKAQAMLVIREVVPRQAPRHQEAGPPLMARLAGGLSHEIRNPMNSILLHLDIVEEEVRHPAPSDCTQVTQSLATIKAELTRLHGLIQDYLFLARLSDLQYTPIDLRTLVEDVVYDLHIQCGRRGITIGLSGLDDLGEAALHESSFRRALFSILHLLIEAVPRDVNLTFSGGRAACHIQLQIHASNKAIPPEVQATLQKALGAKIPDPADLGIYVAQEIITAHGGELVVSDDAKAGVLCTITLPLDIRG